MSAPKAEDPWMFRLALNHLRASDLQLRHPWKEKLRCKVLVERGDSGAGKDKDVHDKAFKSEWQTVGGADVHWRFQMETQLPIFMNSVSAPRVVDWLQRHHLVISLYCNHGSSGSDKSASASSVKKKASYGSVKLPLFDCVTGAINHNMPLLDDAGKTMGRLAFALEAEQVAKVSVHFKRVQLTGLQPVANAGATGLNPYLKYSFSKYWPLVESRKMKAVYSTIQTKTVDPEWVDLPVLTFHTTMREMLKHSIVVHCTHDGGKFAHTTVARANLLFKTLIEGRAKGFSANDEITFKGPLKSGDATIEGSLKLSGLPIFAQCVGGHLSQPLRTEDGLVDARPILPWIMPPRLRMKRSDEDDDEDDSTAAGADAAAGAAAATAAGTDSAPGTPGNRKPRRHMDAEDATHALQRALSASARSQRTETSTSAIRGSHHHHHHHHHRDGKTTPPPSGGGGGGAAAAARGAAGGDLSDTVTTSGSPITVRKPKKSAINKSDSATGLARSAGGDDAGDEEQDAEEAARAEARAVAAAEAAGIPPLRPPPQATTSRVAPTRTRSRSFASAQPPPQTLSAQADASAFVDDLISLASPAKPPTHSARAAIAADADAAAAAAAAAANAEDDPAAARAAYEDQLLAEIAQRTGIAELMAADAKQRTEARLDAPLVPEEDAAAAAAGGAGGAGAAARTPSPGAEGMPDPFADVVLGAGVGDSTVATSVTGDKAPTFDPYGVFSAPAAAPPAAAPAVAAGGVASNNPFASSTEFNPFA